LIKITLSLNNGVDRMLKIAVLVSGRGTNLKAIIKNIKNGDIAASIDIVISDQKDALALDKAAQQGIENTFIDPDAYATVEEYEKSLIHLLDEKNIQLVVLAGFMRILSPYFINYYKNRIMNIHPSLLPSFRGLNAQEQALNYGVKITGCTVHFVDTGMDTGPIILQKAVEVRDDDTVERLSQRILNEEHKIYSKAIKLFSEGKLIIKGRNVNIIKEGE